MTSKNESERSPRQAKQSLKDGNAGIRRPARPDLLSTAAAEWQQAKQTKWSPKMRDIAKCSLAHLLPIMGKRLLMDVEARDIAQYQAARLAEGASNRTVNIEIGILRQVMRKHGSWDRIKADVEKLAEREDCGRSLTAEEERLLLNECGQSRSRLLLPFVTLALETGARFNTIRILQWRNVNFADRCLKFGHDKTAAGTGRTVPFESSRARNVEVFGRPSSLIGNLSIMYSPWKSATSRGQMKHSDSPGPWFTIRTRHNPSET